MTHTEILDSLENFYPQLSREEAKILLSISTYKKFKSREIIFKSGREDKKVILILKGSVRSYDIVEGVELNCHLRSEGYIMGDARAFSDHLVSYLNTEAITKVEALLFDLGELEAIGFENPKIMRFYLDLMKEIILVFAHRIHTFVAMDATGRYEDLMKWNPEYLKSTFDKHLASFLGITPLTFSRIKKKSII